MSAALSNTADRGQIEGALDRTRVVVVVPRNCDPTVAAAAACLASLAGRVFGGVVLRGDGLMPSNPWQVLSLGEAADVWRSSDGDQPPFPRELVVAFGDCAADADWYIGGDDWTAVVSRRTADIGDCVLGGLGLQAAAALTFGELLKQVLAPLGMRCVPVDSTLVWNLLDGRLRPSRPVDLPTKLRHVLVAVLGAGSVGSSAIGLLAMTPVRGSASVVDPDRFDPERNTYRYPLVPAGTIGDKAGWGAEALRVAGWTAEPFVGTIADWVRSRPTPGFDGIALVSVDRVDGRRDAADLIARSTVSVGVSGLALHAHLSLADDDLACSYCAYVDVSPPMSQVDVYADLTGIAPERVAQLLSGARVRSTDVATAVAANKIKAAGAEVLIGGRLEDLLQRRYAQAAVPLDNGLVAQVSAPHVSLLGGVLLAAEVVKAAADLTLLDRRVEVDLRGVPLGGWRRPARDPTGRCTCASPARRVLARRLYAA